MKLQLFMFTFNPERSLQYTPRHRDVVDVIPGPRCDICSTSKEQSSVFYFSKLRIVHNLTSGQHLAVCPSPGPVPDQAVLSSSLFWLQLGRAVAPEGSGDTTPGAAGHWLMLRSATDASSAKTNRCESKQTGKIQLWGRRHRNTALRHRSGALVILLPQPLASGEGYIHPHINNFRNILNDLPSGPLQLLRQRGVRGQKAAVQQSKQPRVSTLFMSIYFHLLFFKYTSL